MFSIATPPSTESQDVTQINADKKFDTPRRALHLSSHMEPDPGTRIADSLISHYRSSYVRRMGGVPHEVLNFSPANGLLDQAPNASIRLERKRSLLFTLETAR